MKKISSLFVCLAVLLAGKAFALELPDALKIPGLTVTGDVRTGLRVEGATVDDTGENAAFAAGRDTGAQNPAAYAYSDDLDDGTPFRAQLQLVWERDNLGVKTRFRYRPDNFDGPQAPGASVTGGGNLSGKLNNLNNTVNKAFVYGYLLDKKIKVSVGKGTDETWGLFYSSFARNDSALNVTGWDGKDGVKIELTPIEGLNLGAFYGTANLFASAVKTNGPFLDQFEAARHFVVGAKYKSDKFSAVFATTHNFIETGYEHVLVGKDESGNNVYADLSYISQNGWDIKRNVDNPFPNTSNLLVGLQLKPIEPLQIDLSVAALNLGSKTVSDAYKDGDEIPGAYKKGDYNPFWGIYPKLKVAYSVNEKLGIALAISDITFADSYYYDVNDATDPEDKGQGNLFPITISPSVSYALTDDITAGAELSFKINNGGSDQFGFGVKPSAEFSLGSGATFVVYDELVFWAKSNDDTEFWAKHPGISPQGGGHQGGNQGASGTTNTLQFDFVWTF
ncbi:MAG: hypothetical protein LBO04_00245 [Spirochaetaceae bacterium]|jgi:hypothetical protein|nr:hypothetical protein [Spirochaetaceae bacterium]